MERQPADTQRLFTRLLEMDTIKARLGEVQRKQAHRSASMRTAL